MAHTVDAADAAVLVVELEDIFVVWSEASLTGDSCKEEACQKEDSRAWGHVAAAAAAPAVVSVVDVSAVAAAVTAAAAVAAWRTASLPCSSKTGCLEELLHG